MSKEYLTVSEVKALLEKERKERDELNQEQALALQHAEAFATLGPRKSRQLVKALLDVEQVTEQYAVKLADLMPTEPDEVRAIFAKERFTLSKEDTQRILDIVAEYL